MDVVAKDSAVARGTGDPAGEHGDREVGVLARGLAEAAQVVDDHQRGIAVDDQHVLCAGRNRGERLHGGVAGAQLGFLGREGDPVAEGASQIRLNQLAAASDDNHGVTSPGFDGG